MLESITKSRSIVILLFTLAIIVRLGALSAREVVETDGVGYIKLAQLFSGADGSSSDKRAMLAAVPPIYPLSISLTHIFIKDWELAGRVASLVYGSALVLLVFFLAQYLYGGRVALLASFLAICEPSLVFSSTQVMTEMAFSVFFVGGILLTLRLFEIRNKAVCLLSGLSWGLCYLIKPESAGFILLICLLIMFGFLFTEKVSLRGRILCAGILCMGFAVLYGSYLFYLKEKTGEWIFLVKSKGALSLCSAALNNMNLEAAFLGLNNKAHQISSHDLVMLLGVYCRNLYYKVQMEILPRLFLLPVLAFAIIGLFRRYWDRIRMRKEIFLLSCASFFILLYPLFLVHERRFVPMVPLVMVWVAKGIDECGDWFKETFGKRRLGLLLALALTISCFVPRITSPIRGVDKFIDQPIEYKEVGRWIDSHLPRDIKVMSRTPEVAFYAERQWEAFPYASLSDVLAYARLKKVDYIVIDARWLVKLRPETAVLLRSKTGQPGLRFVYEWDKRPEYRVVLYEIIK